MKFREISSSGENNMDMMLKSIFPWKIRVTSNQYMITVHTSRSEKTTFEYGGQWWEKGKKSIQMDKKRATGELG
jgi:hypothetical protein